MLKERFQELTPTTRADLEKILRRTKYLPSFLDNGVYRPKSELLYPIRKGIFSLVFDSLAIRGEQNWKEVLDGVEVGKRYIITSNHITDADTVALLEGVGIASESERTKPHITIVAGLKMAERLGTRYFTLSADTIYTPTPGDFLKAKAISEQLKEVGLDLPFFDEYTKLLTVFSRRFLESAQKRLAAGDTLVFFPEGTRSRFGSIDFNIDDRAKRMLTTVWNRLSFGEDDLNIVPVYLGGLYEHFPAEHNGRIISSLILGGLNLRKIKPQVSFGKPYSFAKLSNEGGVRASRTWDKVMARVSSLNPEIS